MDSAAGSPGPSDGNKKATLGKAEACHQCRKRKVKCDAQRPCSNCRRTHHKMIRINPHLSHVEPNCTYDSSPLTPLEAGGSQTVPLQNLSKLEERVAELEKLLGSKRRPSSVGSPDYSTPTWSTGVDGLEHATLFTTPFDIHRSSAFTPDPLRLPIITEQWPLSLPPKPLTFHLLDLFFTCYPNARRIIHRPTFQMQLLEHPSSPRFPFLPLLHSICTAAAMHSHLVTTAPPPTKRGYAFEDVFQEKTRIQQGRQLAFDERHYLIAKYECMAAAREGRDLVGVIQACIINSWWAFGCARWFDLWQCNSLAMRLCIALGLNLPDSLQKPLASKTREKLLIGAPISHTDVELRRNLFWLSYCLERFHLAPNQWAFDINDEDIHQTLPGSLEAFEAGYDDGQERQNVFSADLFTGHYSNQDDFSMYVKCAIMMSRIHTTQCRRLAKLETAEEVRCSPELRIIETMVSSMRSSVLKMKLNPVDQSSTSAISNIYLAHMVPLWATIKIHVDLANWSDPTCESAIKCLAAAKSITQYIVALGSTSWDFSRLDKSAGMCWAAAGRVLVFSLKHAPESLEPVLRAETRLVRNNFLIGGDRVILYLRQRCWFDLEAAEYLGEKEAAKLFAEDEF